MAKAKVYTDRDYMIEAIDEMKLSRDDHEDKPDPMVGAVIVLRGQEGKKPFAKAHRGMLRIGDHAEYTLFERLLPAEDLEGATLYVTLEPCTERSIPKKPCCQRVARARIGKVFIGIVDPNPDIEGQGKAYLESQGIEVAFFEADLAKQIREINDDFIKHWEEQKKIPKPIKPHLPSEFELLTIPDTSEKSFDEKIIKDFLDNAKEDYKIPSPELWEYFVRKGFLRLNEDKKSYTATNAGILLFGKNMADYFPHATIKVEINKTGGARFATEIKGSLLTQPQQVVDLLLSKMDYFTEIKGLKREDVPEYPTEALREAILNAVVHRDYKDKAGSIQILLLKGSLLVKSPGLPIPPINIEDFKKFNVPSYRRNPHISEAFKTMKIMDERGWGLENMRKLLAERKLPEPIFSLDGNYIVLSFLGRDNSEVAELSGELKDIYLFIKEKKKATTKEIQDKFGLSARNAQRHLENLVKNEFIIKVGDRGPGVFFRLFEK